MLKKTIKFIWPICRPTVLGLRICPNISYISYLWLIIVDCLFMIYINYISCIHIRRIIDLNTLHNFILHYDLFPFKRKLFLCLMFLILLTNLIFLSLSNLPDASAGLVTVYPTHLERYRDPTMSWILCLG